MNGRDRNSRIHESFYYFFSENVLESVEQFFFGVRHGVSFLYCLVTLLHGSRNVNLFLDDSDDVRAAQDSDRFTADVDDLSLLNVVDDGVSDLDHEV